MTRAFSSSVRFAACSANRRSLAAASACSCADGSYSTLTYVTTGVRIQVNGGRPYQ